MGFHTCKIFVLKFSYQLHVHIGYFCHVELLNKIMENIKRNQLLWTAINCSRSVSGISLGFYYNSYYVRCDWLIDGRYSALRTPHLIGPY